MKHPSSTALAVAAAASLMLAAAPAAAHVQVLPAAVAPGDPVLFTVLVPSEQDSGTRKVVVQIPAGVIPINFEDQPGWRRTVQEKPNGEIATVTWTGRTRGDQLVRFTFLAGTPTEPGEVAWKSIQTYNDGEVVRWIGAPDSETPAATTRVSADVPRQNAGGESGGGTSGATAPAEATPAPARENSDEDDDGSGAALPIAIAAALLAAAALGGQVLQSHKSSPTYRRK